MDEIIIVGTGGKGKSIYNVDGKFDFKKYREDHKEQINNRMKNYREKNREVINEKNKLHYEKNKEVINAKRRAKYAEKKNYSDGDSN